MMFKKQLATFREVTPVVIFRLLNSCTRETIIAEFTAILKDALERMNMEDMEEDGEFRDAVIPPFSLTVKVPKIQGEDTSVFQGWKGRDNWHRKCIHIGVDKEHQKLVLTLVDEAKRCNLFAPKWGKHVIVTRFEDSGSDKIDLKKVLSASRDHINYHATMTYDGIRGIMDLDRKVSIKSVEDSNVVVGKLSLRDILYDHIKMDDGSPMIAEVHQRTPVSGVDVVIPNVAYAEGQIVQMNKNLAAYLLNYLKDSGMDEAFVKELIRIAVDPTLRIEMNQCEWDAKARSVTSPEEKANATTKLMMEAAWYKDMFSGLTIGNGPAKKQYVDEEVMYRLDDERSATSIHQKAKEKKAKATAPNTYEGTPGAATLNLGANKAGKQIVEVDLSDEEDIDLEKMSKEELVSFMRTRGFKGKGSRPTRSDSKSSSSGSGSESDDESDSDSSSSSSSAGSQEAASEG